MGATSCFSNDSFADMLAVLICQPGLYCYFTHYCDITVACLSYLYSTINPLCYGFLNKDIHKRCSVVSADIVVCG